MTDRLDDGRRAAGIVLLCGRAFSGKSTWAARIASELDAAIVGYDAINAERGLRGGEGIPVAEWVATHREGRDRAAALLREATTVVVDDTSSPRFLRDDWRELARDAGVPLALVHVDIDAAVLRARHALNRAHPRRADIDDDVLEAHLSGFEPPDATEAAIVVTEESSPAAVLGSIGSALARG